MDQLALFALPSYCSIEGCTRTVSQKTLQLCGPHYKRKWRHGDPTAGRPMRVGVKPARPVQDFPDGTRLCNGCAVRKPLDEFPKDPNATAGRRSNCKPCHTARAKDWYAANRDEHLPRQKARYHRDIEKMRARDRARYERDKPKRIELAVESVHRRRALLRSVPNDRGITYQALREKFGDLCHYCRATMTFEPGRWQDVHPVTSNHRASGSTCSRWPSHVGQRGPRLLAVQRPQERNAA